MNNKGVAIRYGDVAPEAKENFKPTSDSAKFDTLHQLQQYNLNFPNYANPCELYSVVLDGTASAFPSVPEDANLGLISYKLSNNDGTFTDPIVLTLTGNGQYSSQGFTFTFDIFNQIYATHINIKWYRNGEIILDANGQPQDKNFYPDNAFYFCRNQVRNYDKVVITFYSINMPKNRLKLRVIDYGYGTFFYGDELRGVKLIQEIDPISTQISINTADFTLDSKSDMDYSFQAKQPLSIYFNGQLKATTFVKKSTRKAKHLWSIQSEDYIGLMDSLPFYGGIYENKSVVDLLNDIFQWQEETQTTKIPYKLDEVFKDATVTGYIPFTTRRDALMQVAFAIQAVVDTSNVGYVNVYKLTADDEFAQEPIPLNRIMQGQNFADDETVTAVEVAVHKYVKKTDTSTNSWIVVYEAAEDGVGNNILVKFSEPLHSLDKRGNGEILESGTNYAIVNANDSSFRLAGLGYDHTTQIRTKQNDVVLKSELEKIVSVENATLVSPSNVDMILNNCYAWLTRTNQVNLKIVEGKHVEYGGKVKFGQKKFGTFKFGETLRSTIIYDEAVNVGDNIQAETEYLGVIGGRLIKQSFNLNGNIIIKEAVLK